jgi:thiol-disulfide isomerase/thioredoxin
MKYFAAVCLMFLSCLTAAAQTEQAPLQEKEIAYKDWTYKSIQTGEDVNLRQIAKGKKLVMVVYFAPWCPNWRHDAPMLQRFYDKYKANGLEIVGVGLYDPVASMKTNLDTLKVTFPAVYESEARDAKQKSLHYEYRRFTGDARNWGSPWYIFLDRTHLDSKDGVLTRKAFIVNGELIESEGEQFIRKQLGLPASELKATIPAN